MKFKTPSAGADARNSSVVTLDRSTPRQYLSQTFVKATCAGSPFVAHAVEYVNGTISPASATHCSEFVRESAKKSALSGDSAPMATSLTSVSPTGSPAISTRWILKKGPCSSVVATGHGERPQTCLTISRGVFVQSIGQSSFVSCLV